MGNFVVYGFLKREWLWYVRELGVRNFKIYSLYYCVFCFFWVFLGF